MADEQPATGGVRWLSRGPMKVLAVVFTVAAVGSVVLVAVDLAIGRPAGGDVFIAMLNSAAAAAFWWMASASRHA